MGFDLYALKQQPRKLRVIPKWKNPKTKSQYTAKWYNMEQKCGMYYRGMGWSNVLHHLLPLMEQDLSTSKVALWNTFSGLCYNDGVKYDHAITNLMVKKLEAFISNSKKLRKNFISPNGQKYPLEHLDYIKQFIEFARQRKGFQVN